MINPRGSVQQRNAVVEFDIFSAFCEETNSLTNSWLVNEKPPWKPKIPEGQQREFPVG